MTTKLALQLKKEAIVFAFPRLSDVKSSVTNIHEIGPSFEVFYNKSLLLYFIDQIT